MIEKPVDAPACFAAATVFSRDSEICRGCSAFEECAGASLETLQRIQQIVDVSDLLKRHAIVRKREVKPVEKDDVTVGTPISAVQRKTNVERVTMTIKEADEQVLACIQSKKPKEIVLQMAKSGSLDLMREGLKKGENGLAKTGPSFMREAVYALLDGGFTKLQLRDLFVNRLNWTENTAASHVSIAVAILKSFKLVREESGRFVLENQ